MAPNRRRSKSKFHLLLPHEFECSDLPKSFFRGMFSCSACDEWRIRSVHGRRHKGGATQSILRTERFQCQRRNRGKKLIRFRVIVGSDKGKQAEVSNCVTKEPAAMATLPKERAIKERAAAKAEVNRQKDVEAAAVRARLVKDAANKKLDNTKKKDEAVVLNAIDAFNRSTIIKLTSTLQDALVEKSKFLAMEAQLKISEQRRIKAEEALKEEQQITKNLRNQLFYYKKRLSMVLERKNVVVKKVSDDATSLDVLVNKIEDAFGICMKGAHNATKAGTLLELISTGLLFSGGGLSTLESMHRDFVKNIFSPWKLVYASDMSPAGSFRTATVSGLSEFFDAADEYDDDEGDKKQRMFPSASKVSRECQALNKYAVSKVGLSRKDSKYGEIYYLDSERVIRLLLEAAGLSEIAQRESVHIAVTSDGAISFHNRTQISIGIKIVDTRAHHCKTKVPLFVRSLEDDVEDDPGYFRGVQSSEMCTVCIMADARDKSKMYTEVFKYFYKYTESLRKDGMPASEFGPYLPPFVITYPSDLKAIWTTSGRGGNCKKTIFFCHLCSATRHDLVSWKEGSQRCNRCIRRNKSRCYHHQVCDSTTVERLLSDLEDTLQEYLDTSDKEYEEILSKTKLQYDHMMAMRHLCDTHIDYHILQDNPQKANQYASFIAKECRLRGIRINVRDGVEEWRHQLCISIAMESKIKLLKQVRQWKDEGVLKVPLVLYAELLIPCILHLENRVGEKILTMILRKGWELWSGPPKKYIEDLEAVFQKKILGTDASPAHWSLPYEGKTDAEINVGKITGNNEVIRHLVRQIDVIIEAAFPPSHPLQQKLILAISSYRSAVQLLNSHYHLSEDEIERYQDFADDFFEHWIGVFGVTGVTNYIHLIGSGHMQYFLTNYGCLYLYSQQGWEALMGKIQAILHLNTQRGGKGSGGGKNKSFIYPVMLYILRDLLWKTGDARRFFLDREKARSLA